MWRRCAGWRNRATSMNRNGFAAITPERRLEIARLGGLSRKYPSLKERLETKVMILVDVECWFWIGNLRREGYGHFHISGKTQSADAHRTMYQELVGPVPDGMELDHLCRNRSCVNPDHLEPVTHQENMRRGKLAQKTHCPQGHPYTADNLTGRSGIRESGKRWRRECLTCKREADRRWRDILRSREF